MNGVILWTDTTQREAVVWCDAHGELAFIDGQTEDPDVRGFFAVGDLVTFDLTSRGRTKHAQNPVLLDQSRDIRARSKRQARSFSLAKIIPFGPLAVRTERAL